MGEMEQQSRRRSRNSKITRAILTTLAVATVGALNPVGLARGVLRELGKSKGKNTAHRSSLYAARGRLLKRGLIEYENGVFSITESGKRFLRKAEGYSEPTKPRRWDKKWRILIFDIREERKVLRDKVRATLASLGFKLLQKSVWVYPHDCEDLIALLKADFKIGKDLLYIIADTIENDVKLKKEFGLR